ncbi:hypothetical protein TTHERM_00444160 (macronuclear) [Tetrahymena thermophila SB210]|uniref:Uncharacterized protein n=1 Tax=Tetrahymena thermophila (strain SB210) TaxID=312017 RepID=I7MLT5_TETTS|nr:hypothetical protein TTHERM_00444160 [Tetrahymena thermophila SB210]EAS03033.2 hypothetical protein TTHERM_00444160 [Tetrahymena thermophila SB210]|eukprot:XP_001023278.2 hypothetical protein TTHERM_00444160 [Tetrahymena thermophila SB210]
MQSRLNLELNNLNSQDFIESTAKKNDSSQIYKYSKRYAGTLNNSVILSQKEREVNEITYRLNKARDMAKENIYIMYPSLKHSIDYLSTPVRKLPQYQQISLKYPQTTKKQNFPPINLKSYDNLKISSELDIIRAPPRVQSLSELNKQVFFRDFKLKKKKKPYEGLDNRLEIEFPIHNEKDFVNLHSQGFKGKQNIDLFKHYLRMYMKNKYKVNQIKKERRDKHNKTLDSSKQNQFKQHDEFQNNTGSYLVDSIFENLAPLSKKNSIIKSPLARSPKNSQFLTNFKKSQQLVKQRMSLQEYIVDKSLNDVILFDNVITAYEQSNFKNQNEINQALNYSSNLNRKSLLDQLSEKIQNKVNIINIDPNTLPSIQDNKENETMFLIEEIFITQIMNKIAKHGLSILNLPDYRDFKRIVLSRKKMLQNLSDQIRVEKLINIKKNLNQHYNQEQEAQFFQKKEQFQKLKQDEYLKCTQIYNSDQQIKDQASYQINKLSNLEVSLDSSEYQNRFQNMNENFQNLSIKLSPITSRKYNNEKLNSIKILSSINDGIGISSPNISELHTNREKHSLHLDYTNIEIKKRDYEEIETQENIRSENSLAKVEIEKISENITNLVKSPNNFVDLQEKLRQRLAERNAINKTSVPSVIGNQSQIEVEKVENKINEKIVNESFSYQQEKSTLINGEQQSTRYMSQINDLNSINKSNCNGLYDNSTILSNVENKEISQVIQHKKIKNKAQHSQISQNIKQTDVQEEQKEKQEDQKQMQNESDETIELLLDVAQKYGIVEELMNLFQQEEGQQPISKEEREVRLKKFMEQVEEYTKEHEFQQKIKEKQKAQAIKFEKKKIEKIKKKKKLASSSNQNLSQINVLDDPSLININTNNSRENSVDKEDLNSQIESRTNENDNQHTNEIMILPSLNYNTNSENTDEEQANSKGQPSNLNLKKIKRVPIPSISERIYTEDIKTSRSDQNILIKEKQLAKNLTENQVQYSSEIDAQKANKFYAGQSKNIKKQEDNNDYYELFSQNKTNNKSDVEISYKSDSNKGSSRLISQKLLKNGELNRYKPTPKSQIQVAVTEQQQRLQESIKKKNTEMQKFLMRDMRSQNEQMLSKKRELENTLKVNFGQRSENTKVRERKRSQSPNDKSNNSSFGKNNFQQIFKKDEQLIQAQRKELMIKYYGEEKRQEIMMNTYTYEDEKEIKEKIKAKEEAIKKKMKIAATKMTIQQEKFEDLDPEMLIFQDILETHKKANEKLFHKIVSPQKKVKQKRKINFEKKFSEQLDIINEKEDKKLIDSLKHTKSVQLPGFFENQKLLEEINEGLYDDTILQRKQIKNQNEIVEKVVQDSQHLKSNSQEINALKKSDSSSKNFQIDNSNKNQNTEFNLDQIAIKTVSDYKQTFTSKSDQVEQTVTDRETVKELELTQSIDQTSRKDLHLTAEITEDDNQQEDVDDDDYDDDDEDEDQNESEIEYQQEEISNLMESKLTNSELANEQTVHHIVSEIQTIQEIDEKEKLTEEVIENQVDTQGNVVAVKVVKIKSPKKKQAKNQTPQKKRKTKVVTKVESDSKQNEELGEVREDIQEEEKKVKTKKKKVQKKVEDEDIANMYSFLQADKEEKKETKTKKKKKKIAKKKDEDYSQSDSQDQEVKEELGDSIQEIVNTSATKKTKKLKKKADESSFSKPKRKRTDTLQQQSDESPDSSFQKLSSQNISSVGQTLNDIVTDQKSAKLAKEERLKREKKQRMEEAKQRKEEEIRLKKEEERQKREEERLRKEEERLRREEEKQRKEEERLRKEEERRKIELEKQRIREERQKKFNQELEKLREFNFADEMELLKKRKLTLRELKEEIEYTIEKLGDQVDDESKYNILSYKQRIEQIQHFLESLDSAIDFTLENNDIPRDYLKEIFNVKNRWVRDKYKEKILKFQKEIQQPEADQGIFSDIKGEAVGEQEIQLILKYASLNQDVEGILQRMLQFSDDTNQLIKIKQMIRSMKSNVSQIGLDIINYVKIKTQKDDDDDEAQTDQPILLSETSQKQSETKFDNDKILLKLKKLKKYHKDRFEMVLQNQNKIRENNNFLKSINYKSQIDQEIINTYSVAKKSQIWASKFNPSVF